MDWIHKFLNTLVPIMSFIIFPFFLPFFLVFKFLQSIVRSIFSENVAGKLVIITGASSGIGEHLAYEYAKRGACLVLVARREDRLLKVAERSRCLGSPDVIVIPADISKFEDCKRFVDEAMNHFGRVDHLVNNAGIAPTCTFEDPICIADYAPVMDINFWGSVQSTHLALPHLKRSKGKIIVIASCAGWLPTPRLSFYSASKGALISFYETLRTEVGSDIGITIVAPGYIKSEITQGEFLRKAKLKYVPMESTEGSAKAILKSTCRGERYLIEPAWGRMVFLWKVFCPEVVEWSTRLLSTG